METETSAPESPSDLATPGAPVVLMRTSVGDIQIEFYPQEAPESVDNFIRYVEDGHFDGTIFHRVVRGFVIQGGGFTAEMEEKDTREPIPNEAQNGLRNMRGTLSMARTGDPHSATSQFFVNTKDNAVLDHTGTTMRRLGLRRLRQSHLGDGCRGPDRGKSGGQPRRPQRRAGDPDRRRVGNRRFALSS